MTTIQTENEDIFGMFTFFVSGGKTKTKKQKGKWWESGDNWSETKTIELDPLSFFYWWIIAKIIFAKKIVEREIGGLCSWVIRQRKREMTTLCEWWWVVRHTQTDTRCVCCSVDTTAIMFLNNVSAGRMPFWQKDEHPEALLNGIPPCVLSYMFSNFHSEKRKEKRNLYRRRKEERQVENHQFMMMRSLLYSSSRSLYLHLLRVCVCVLYLYVCITFPYHGVLFLCLCVCTVWFVLLDG